uniref:Uncharacterized protein n=1 Tax=Lepeophtheirus salmonis TaxID=72036 RepID=A0A0K2V221_LEPSM
MTNEKSIFSKRSIRFWDV